MAGNGTTLTDMESEWGSAAVLILAVLLGVFIVVASLGNLLVMVSILITRKQCDRGYIFIFNLSVVDFLTAVCIMPISVSTLIHGDFIYSHAACVFNGFMVQVLFITSIHTLMYMAIYRYLAICDPFTPVHICKVGLMIAASWTLAILISSLSFGILGHFVYKPFTTQCGPVYPQDVKGWINIGIVASICFLLPLAIIVFVYVLLFRKAHRLFTRLEDPSYSSYSREVHVEQRRISITCIIIVVSFLICWTPIFAYLNYASFVHDKKSIPTLINPIVYWFSYLNSAINPLIYGLRTPIFKRIIDAICGCQKDSQSRKPPISEQSLTTTVANPDVAGPPLATFDADDLSVQ
ncbi:melatonin receptor type 1C-like [Watersipora subatra]|uniref:melatonin receptor type 1C-like n=1 Tax=Watersipora subatra TaxID=2589382 RepID=UPI00355B8599